MDYKKSLISLCTFIMCLFTFNTIQAQDCVCDYELENYCPYEYYLPVYPEMDITELLREAVQYRCKVVIPNTGPDINGQVVYYVKPITFSGDSNHPNTAVSNRTIVLESGVILEGINGAFSECSQSMFTFDGNANRNIEIIGEHDACSPNSVRPILRMRDYSYTPFNHQIYLVASDDVGDPYLNSNGQPNYIFDDGDSDPYFDNNGDPNIIPPGSNLPKVPATEEYNDFNCNRTIIAWNPRSWQARHAIALYGVQKAHIANIRIEHITGDGIHISDDKNGEPARRVEIDNVRFLDNGISGMTVSSGKCIWMHDCEVGETGSILENNPTPIETEGGLLFQEHLNEGSLLASEIEMDSITIEYSTIHNNINRGIWIDLPRVATDEDCDDESDFIFNRLCISYSRIGIDYHESHLEQQGRIILKRSSISRCEYGAVINDAWKGMQDIIWESVNLIYNGIPVVNMPGSSLCSNWDPTDVCSEPPFSLCGQDFECNPGGAPDCGSLFTCEDDTGGGDCDITLEITPDSEVDCDCDFLFIVDESGSISSEEFAAMEESIVQTARAVAECGGRVAMTHFNSSSHWVYGFSDTSFCDLGRDATGGTNIGNAIDLAVDSLRNQEEEYGEEGRCLHVFLHTDASCSQYNLNGSNLGALQDMATSISVIFYDTNVYDEDCHPDLNDQIVDGIGEEYLFGFDSIDIDLTELLNGTYFLNLSIMGDCDPLGIAWNATDGGEILDNSYGGMQVETNGEGVYTVDVYCSNGCVVSQTIDYDDIEIDTTSYEVPCDSIGVDDDDDGERRIGYVSGHEEDEMIKALGAEIDVQIFPNPFNDELTIQVGQHAALEIEIFDLYGRLVYKTQTGANGKKTNISTQDWFEGVYFVQWVTPDGTTQQQKVMLID